MKRMLLFLYAFFLVAICSAQTLDEIVNRSYTATGSENLDKINTLYIEGKSVQMGMEMPLYMYMKKPDKVKVTVVYNGMEIVTAFDGEKGYMVNPMMGSSEPTEIPQEQLEGVKQNNIFRNTLLDSYRQGKLQLMGSEDVGGKPAFKIKISIDSGAPLYYFIDKESYLNVKTATTTNQMGQEMEVEQIVKEYTTVNGVKFPKLTVAVVNGSEMGSTTLEKIEMDKPMDDAIFKIK